MREEGVEGAEVHVVHQHAAFGDVAQEAAVDPCLVHLEEEEVVLPLGQRDHIAAPFFAEEEGVEAYLAAGEDVEAGIVPAALHEGGEEAALAHGPHQADDLALFEAGEDEFEILDILLYGGHLHGVIHYVEAAAGILRVEELGADVAHHVDELSALEGLCPALRLRQLRHDLVGQGYALLHAWLADALVGLALAVVEVFVALHEVVLSFEPAVEALLAAVGLPHGEEGAEFLHGGHAAHDVLHLLEGGLADAHSLCHLGREDLLVLRVGDGVGSGGVAGLLKIARRCKNMVLKIARRCKNMVLKIARRCKFIKNKVVCN